MTSHASVAKSVRLRKEQHPELYCPADNCLWRTSPSGDEKVGKYCPRHANLCTCGGTGAEPNPYGRDGYTRCCGCISKGAKS
jgi:hypothetical protein